MSLIIPLWATLTVFSALWSPIAVYESHECPPYTQGYVKEGKVVICPDQLTLPRQEVINHEVVHLIQAHLGVDTLLPKGTVHYLVSETLSEAETLSVLIHYSNSGYIDSEFEARVLQKVPSPVIMLLYRLSKDYAFLTTRYNLPLLM